MEIGGRFDVSEQCIRSESVSDHGGVDEGLLAADYDIDTSEDRTDRHRWKGYDGGRADSKRRKLVVECDVRGWDYRVVRGEPTTEVLVGRLQVQKAG